MALGQLLVFTLNVLSAVVAFLTSYNAYRFNRLAGSPLLNSIALGFMLLGVGLLLEAGTSVARGLTLVDSVTRALAALESFAYLSIQMVAYVVFAAGYAFMAFGKSAKTATVAGLLLVPPRVVGALGLYRYALVSYFVVFVLLAFIVFQGVLIHSQSRSRFSLFVLLAFVLILIAHLLLLASVVGLSGDLFFVGTVVQFLGFVSLFAFLLRSGRVGAG